MKSRYETAKNVFIDSVDIDDYIELKEEVIIVSDEPTDNNEDLEEDISARKLEELNAKMEHESDF